MDRFRPPGPADEPTVVTVCTWCGEDIYAGDTVMRIDDDTGYVHDDVDCAVRYAIERVYDASGIINERGDIE